MRTGKARAYCSSANLGPGFDVLAVALDAYYDEVAVRAWPGKRRVKVVSIQGPYARSVNPFRNTARRAVEELLETYMLDCTVELSLWKGVPVGYGLGSSGASAAAAVEATAEALGLELKPEEKVILAGVGEKEAAGTPHFDNAAASVLGWLAIVYSQNPLKVVSHRVNAWFAVSTPKVETPPSKTEAMRKVIPPVVELEKTVYNAGRLAALVYGLTTGNLRIAGDGMDDQIVESARAPLIPCYHEVKRAALEAGACGVAVSGAGPSMIALCEGRREALRVAEAMRRAYALHGIDAIVNVARPAPGVHCRV